MSWLTEGPLSRMGGNSRAAQGARMGAAAGPIGMAAGALGGWLMDRIQNGRLQAMSGNSARDFADRQGSRTNWDASPMDQFDTTPTEFGGTGGHSSGGVTTQAPFEGFGAGVLFEDKPSENVVADELGITDWSNIGDEGKPAGAVQVRSDDTPKGPKGWKPGKGFFGDAWTGMSQGGDVHGMVIRGIQPGLGSGQKWFHNRKSGK